MGLSKTKTKNEPWSKAQPYILKGMENSNRVFDAQQPNLDKFSAMQMETYGKLAPGAEQGIMGSQSLINDTIAGKYLNGNPYMQGMLDRANEDTVSSLASMYSRAGRYGSDYMNDATVRALANNENQYRFNNYAQERQNQLNAVGQAQNLMGGATSLLNNAAALPWTGVGALNGNIRQASSGYGTTTQSGGLGNALVGGAFSALGSYLGRPGQ